MGLPLHPGARKLLRADSPRFDPAGAADDAAPDASFAWTRFGGESLDRAASARRADARGAAKLVPRTFEYPWPGSAAAMSAPGQRSRGGRPGRPPAVHGPLASTPVTATTPGIGCRILRRRGRPVVTHRCDDLDPARTKCLHRSADKPVLRADKADVNNPRTFRREPAQRTDDRTSRPRGARSTIDVGDEER